MSTVNGYNSFNTLTLVELWLTIEGGQGVTLNAEFTREVTLYDISVDCTKLSEVQSRGLC